MKINYTLLFICLSLSLFAQVPSYVPTNGLVGYWPFNGNANDESGNGSNASVFGATLTVDKNSISNKAYNFDGINDTIVVNNTSILDLDTSVSISFSFWIKSASNSNTQTIYSKRDLTTGHGIEILTGLDSLRVYYGVGSGVGNYVWHSISTQLFLEDSFHFISVIINQNNKTIYCYIDGVLQNNSISLIGLNGNFKNSSKHYFGGRSSTYFFDGTIDDIGIWNRILTEQEITNLYNECSAQTLTATPNICTGEIYTVGASSYTTAGNYIDTLQTAGGCDSIIHTNLSVSNPIPYYIDNDQDGLGDTNVVIMACSAPLGFTQSGGDCDDANEQIRDPQPFFADLDLDTYGDINNLVVACTSPPGYVSNYIDCDDNNSQSSIMITYYEDADVDGYGNASSYVNSCELLPPTGYVTNNTDCDDSDPDKHNLGIYYVDADGYGDMIFPTTICGPQTGYSENSYDCDDSNISIVPSISNFTHSMCDGESYSFNAFTFTEAGNYISVLPASNGCDSVIILDLTVHSIYTANNYQSICEGEGYTINGNTYVYPGDYVDAFTSINGCDSIITTYLTVNAAYNDTNYVSLCGLGTVTVGSNTYTSAGVYVDSMQTTLGCDSIITTVVSDGTYGLIAKYEFAGDLSDGSGNNNHGINNGAQITTDRFGNENRAVNFAGGAYIDYGYGVNTGNSFSTSMWIKTSMAPGSSFPQIAMILSKENGSGFNKDWAIGIGNGGKLIFKKGHQGSGDFIEVQTTNNINNNTWTHIIIATDSVTVKLYVNGVLDVEQTHPYFALNNASIKLIAGYYDDAPQLSPSPMYYQGQLDDIRIYNRALSTCEIAALFNEGNAVQCTTVYNSNPQTVCVGRSYIFNNHEYDVAGTYYDTLQTSIGCDSIIVTDLQIQQVLNLIMNITDASCGLNNGAASVNVSGGNSPYLYSWTSGENGDSATDLGAGFYQVGVADANGCKAKGSATINSSGGPGISLINKVDASCYGANNGSATVSVSGQNISAVYWSNGDSGLFANKLRAGNYEVVVLDTAGCRTFLQVSISEPDIIKIQMDKSDAGCSQNNGGAMAHVTGGTAPYSFMWSNGVMDSINNNIVAGVYLLNVSDANSCNKAAIATIENIGGPIINIDSVKSTSCGNIAGGIYISVTGGAGSYTYSWNNGNTGQDLSNAPKGAYSVSVSDAFNCTSILNALISGEPIPNPELCLITAEQGTSNNLLVWDKSTMPESVVGYKIYKEFNITNKFDSIAYVPTDSLSEYVDKNSNFLARAYRYKITAVDSCGNESSKSQYHKTLHLTINQGLSPNIVNLIWDDYEGYGYSSFYIWRFTQSTGWQVIDSLPTILHMYTDNNAPNQGALAYYIEIRRDAGSCIAERVKNYNASRSNTASLRVGDFTVIKESGIEIKKGLSIYPNPSSGVFTITAANGLNCVVYNTLGKKIKQLEFKTDVSEINLSNCANGVYFVETTDTNGTKAFFKLVKE